MSYTLAFGLAFSLLAATESESKDSTGNHHPFRVEDAANCDRNSVKFKVGSAIENFLKEKITGQRETVETFYDVGGGSVVQYDRQSQLIWIVVLPRFDESPCQLVHMSHQELNKIGVDVHSVKTVISRFFSNGLSPDPPFSIRASKIVTVGEISKAINRSELKRFSSTDPKPE